MERRVKERLLGATLLSTLVVLIVPELLSGPKRPAAAPPAPIAAPVHTVTVDLTQRVTMPEPAQTVLPASAAATIEPAPSTQIEAAPAPAPAPASAAAALPPARAANGWAVQLGSFAAKEHADRLVRGLKDEGHAVYVVSIGAGAGARYRVRMGPLADRAAAERAIAKLKAQGHAAALVPPAP